ncbi:uncharacterized protein LOC113505372 [Trichoplusia ni]|uniref:Gustatory receptor n=1 Tax=Trichoplusia ni TaxID=7111 RepID=A0A7E5WUJ4_TRINI|nr:uncharacterized protein LOC113505372 [Trichoplusia ni]
MIAVNSRRLDASEETCDEVNMIEDQEPDNKSTMEEIDSCDIKNNVIEVVHTIKPLTAMEYLCGIFKFKLVNGEILSPNKIMKMVALLFIFVYYATFLISLKAPAMKNDTDNMLRLINAVPSMVTLIHYLVSVIKASFASNLKYQNIITTLAELDQMILSNNFGDYYGKLRSTTNKYVICLIITHIIHATIFMKTQTVYLMEMCNCHLYLFQKTELLGFCTLIAMVRSRLLVLNKYLSSFVQEQEKKNVKVFTVTERICATQDKLNFIGRPSEKNYKIRDLSTIYDTIGQVCDLVNDVFNFKLFFTVLSLFMYVIVTIWISLYYYRSSDYDSNNMINVALCSTSTILTLACISFACEQLLLERKKSKILINKVIMNYGLPKTMRVQAKAFMELVESWSLRIFIYDMFSVDITLMLKFISVSTTFLIVLIQIANLI